MTLYYLGKTEIQALKVKCPNACGNAVERQQLKNHVRNECSHTMTSCKYKGIGCDTELKREDMAAHEQDDKLHLHMALETVATLKEESHTLKGSMTFVLYDYQKKKDANTYYEFSDPTFYTHPKGYHMTLRVYANGSGDSAGTHVSVFAYILKGKYDAELKWPFVGSVTFTLLNQLGDYGHQTGTLYFTTEDNRRVGDCWGFPAFVPHSALAHGLFNNPQYLNDDKLYFRVSAKVADRKPWLE